MLVSASFITVVKTRVTSHPGKLLAVVGCETGAERLNVLLVGENVFGGWLKNVFGEISFLGRELPYAAR